MNREEVLARLRESRAEFDALVVAVPEAAMTMPVPGGTHTPAQIVAHVAAYDELIVERLRAARRGETTGFDRDRAGWERFNDRVWEESAGVSGADAVERAGYVFGSLLEEVAALEEWELAGMGGASEHLDPAWLGDKTSWEMIGIDAFDHYPLHFDQLRAAAQA